MMKGPYLLFLLVGLAATVYLLPLRTNENAEGLDRALLYARTDPVMGMEGTDPQKLLESVENLRSVTVEIAQTFVDAGQRESGRLLPYMFPFSFLENLAAVESLRLNFIAHPSWQNLHTYERAQASALEAYRHDLNISQRIAARAFTDKEKKYSFIGSTITPDDIFRALGDQQRGIAEIAEKLKAQQRCERGDAASCPRVQHIQKNEVGAVTKTSHPPVPALVAQARTLIDETITPASKHGVTYPIVVIDAVNACLGFYSAPLFVLPIDRFTDSNQEAFYIHPLNDLYFWDAKRGADNVGIAYFQTMVEKGLSYSYQPTANFYLCPDNTSTSAHVATVLTLAKRITANHALLEPLLGDSLKALSSTKVIYEGDVEEALAKLEARRDGAPPETAALIDSLLLLKKTQSALFDQVIASVTLQSESYLRAHALNYFRAFPADYAFLARAPLPLSYLYFNPEVAGPIDPLVLPHHQGGWNPIFLSYRSDVSKISGLNVLEQMRKTARYELGLPLQ